MLGGNGRWDMSEYIYSIVCFAGAVGLILIVVPEGARGGLLKHVRLVGSLCLICLIIKPSAELIGYIKELGEGDLSVIFGNVQENELYDKYEDIYREYLHGGYGENVGEAVKDALAEKFNIDRNDVRCLVEFGDEVGGGIKEPRKITVIVKGRAVLTDPQSIKDLISGVFGCECEVAVE